MKVLMAVLLWLLVPGSVGSVSAEPVQSEDGPEPQVRAILFYSPECPHCHDVMEDHLPPLFDRHGEALQIVAVNVDTRQGQALYQAVAEHFELPRQRLGVPALVVGERILVGSWEIPSQLPGLVEEGLAGSGIDWPPIPEVQSYLSLQGIAAGPTVRLESWMLAGGAAAGGEPAIRILGAGRGTGTTSVAERFLNDPLGNGIAVLVLLGMVIVLALSVRAVYRPRRPLPEWPAWAIPALAVAGVLIASYMAFVEVTGTEAVCGPVGDCNRVQLSPYASVAGVPVGVLGILGYLV
ncbi:MAG: vitamin K epoxide reductase family protein, partial [Gemmatimonadota bacterium]